MENEIELVAVGRENLICGTVPTTFFPKLGIRKDCCLDCAVAMTLANT